LGKGKKLTENRIKETLRDESFPPWLEKLQNGRVCSKKLQNFGENLGFLRFSKNISIF
jgi:hypothetical protein